MWAKYCEIIDNNLFVQSMCIPSGSPMTAAPDIMTSSTSSLQGSRKSSGLRSESHDVKASCICTQFTSCYSSSMLLCTHNGFWKHHILFLPEMHLSLYAMWGRMHRTWQNFWKREDDISQSESKHHFSLWYLGTRHQSHAFVEPHNLNSVCHHWNDLYLRVLHFNLNLSSKSDFMTVHFKNVPIMIIF